MFYLVLQDTTFFTENWILNQCQLEASHLPNKADEIQPNLFNHVTSTQIECTTTEIVFDSASKYLGFVINNFLYFKPQYSKNKILFVGELA